MPAPPNHLNQFLDELNVFKEILLPSATTDYTFDLLTNIFNEFGSFLTALDTYTRSMSFPNVNLSDYDHQLYQLSFMSVLQGDINNGLLWKPIYDMPNVLFQGGTLKHRKGFNQLSEIKARHIVGNVTGAQVGGVRLGAKDAMGRGFALMPFPHAAQWNKVLGLSYHTGNGFFTPPTSKEGDLRLVKGQIVEYQSGVWNGISLPRRADDLHAASPMPVVEGDVRAKSDDSGLEVYRSGAWVNLWTF